jgi:hypothetical protein
VFVDITLGTRAKSLLASALLRRTISQHGSIGTALSMRGTIQVASETKNTVMALAGDSLCTVEREPPWPNPKCNASKKGAGRRNAIPTQMSSRLRSVRPQAALRASCSADSRYRWVSFGLPVPWLDWDLIRPARMRLLLLEIRLWQCQPAARQQDSARLLVSFRGGCLRFSGSANAIRSQSASADRFSDFRREDSSGAHLGFHANKLARSSPLPDG